MCCIYFVFCIFNVTTWSTGSWSYGYQVPIVLWNLYVQIFFLIPLFAYRMCSFFHIIKKNIFPSGFIKESYCTKILKELLSLVKEGNHTINPVPQLPFIGGTIVFLNVIFVSALFYAILITWYTFLIHSPIQSLVYQKMLFLRLSLPT